MFQRRSLKNKGQGGEQNPPSEGGQGDKPAPGGTSPQAASPRSTNPQSQNPPGQGRSRNRRRRGGRGRNPNQSQNQGNQNPAPVIGTNLIPNAGFAPPPLPGQRRQNQQRQGNRQGRSGQQGNRSQQNQQRQGQRQQGRIEQPRRQQPRPPPPPPAYIQRDLLLVATADTAKAIEEVRAKFDPLAKKIPAHVTLVFPEPEANLSKEFLKPLQTSELPAISSLTFSQVTIQDDMYLWLVPDHESAEKLRAWREFLLKQLSAHTQEPAYEPHITLGYIPRSISPEDAITFAKTAISLPLTVNFEKILLEEFAENQVSTAVDTVTFDNPQPI
jgi:hypothetical protein